MPRFFLERTVRADRQSVFDVFTDYAGYVRSVPSHFAFVRVRSVRGDTAVVEEHIRLGARDLVTMAKHVLRAPSVHDTFVIGGDIKGTHIRQRFDAISGGKTRVTVDADIRRLGIRGIFATNASCKRDYAAILDGLAHACGSDTTTDDGSNNDDGGKQQRRRD